MPENVTVFFLVAAFVMVLVGFAKGGLGGAAGTMATPIMALVLPVSKAVGLMLPILMLADLFTVAVHWKRWNWRYVALLLPGSVAGVTAGTYFITTAASDTLRTALGVIVLIFALYKVSEGYLLRWISYQSRDWHGLLAGTISGFTSALAHTGGPPVRVYLLMQKVSPAVFIGTTGLFFMILNWIKVPYYFYARLFDFRLLGQVLWLMPLIPVGVMAGRRLSDHIDPQTFERIIVILLAANATLLILS